MVKNIVNIYAAIQEILFGTKSVDYTILEIEDIKNIQKIEI